ncbi:MAG TPA: hypothetical protein VM513_04070, partial [Kofleriaceae bacterium]|nr:hypothetical protein [Kofleriaceae bacterium]
MRAWAAVVVLAVASCGGDDGPNRLTPIDASTTPDAPELYPVVLELEASVNRSLDVLFVIDDSAGMTDKQNNLAASFPSFIEVLNSGPGGLPDLHLGVATTDMGVRASDGTFGSTVGACDGNGKAGNLTTSGASVTGAFVSDVAQTDGSRARNYAGTLEAVFSQMAKVGASGCGFEQPLAAMKAALDNHPANAGFLRPDATLAVVFGRRRRRLLGERLDVV